MERMVLKEDIEQLLLNLRYDSPDWSDDHLAKSLMMIENDYDIDLGDYLSDDMMNYMHMHWIEDCID